MEVEFGRVATLAPSKEQLSHDEVGSENQEYCHQDSGVDNRET
jgi:hypothetical protein